MTTLTHSPDRNGLLLTYVGFDGVEFGLLDENGQHVRAVRVNVGSGTSSGKTVRFPDLLGEASTSTGDDQLDREIRERAAEELVRLEAAAAALRAVA